MAQESAYQLLLYAQLLHLPDLAEWCKSFLRAAAAQGQDCHLPNLDGICRATAKIARPVPRKPSVVAPLAEEADEGKQSPAQIFQGTLERPPPTSLGSPFLKGQFSNWPTPPPPPPPQLTTGLFIPPPPPLPSSTIPSLPLSSLYPVACRRPVVVISRDWDGEEEEEEEEEIVVGTEEDAHSTTLSTARKSASSSSTTAAELPPSSSNFEVAACDGPVRFHRVANPCTAKSALGSSSSSSSDEEDQDCPSSSSSGAPSDVTYQCLFCNHIFKSHYCYQKHKRRHLNPFVADFHQVSSPDKKSLILKDINVQFFPCKVCGAKFPSYYFVHKHKKLWHEDEDCNNREEEEEKDGKKEEEQFAEQESNPSRDERE